MIGLITKVKRSKEKIEVHWADSRPGAEKESVFRCTEKAHPDFDLAFDRLEQHVRDILDLSSGTWPGMIKVTGVTFSLSENTGVEGAVITGQVALDTSNAPFCFNTPHLPFGQYSPMGKAPTLSATAIRDLERLRDEAGAFVDGTKRAQLELAAVAP